MKLKVKAGKLMESAAKERNRPVIYHDSSFGNVWYLGSGTESPHKRPK